MKPVSVSLISRTFIKGFQCAMHWIQIQKRQSLTLGSLCCHGTMKESRRKECKLVGNEEMVGLGAFLKQKLWEEFFALSSSCPGRGAEDTEGADEV